MTDLSSELLGVIFLAIRREMMVFEKDNLISKVSTDRSYDLWTRKPVVIQGRKYKGVNLAGVKVQGGFVGFYYMPIYTQCDRIKKSLPIELLNKLKGKACFHITDKEESTMAHFAQAMIIGRDLYMELGWL